MRKRSTLRTWFIAIPAFVGMAVVGAQAARGNEPLLSASSELSNESLDRARGEVARVQILVGEGSLPKTSLTEAQARLGDLKDQAVLEETLFSARNTADLSASEQTLMIEAAERRYERQAELVCQRRRLLDMGIIAEAEMHAATNELENRRHIVDLARRRVRTIALRQNMAQEQQALEQALESGTSSTAMVKFEGGGVFYRSDFQTIAGEFEEVFHYPIPVTARGQTQLHDSLGLDHRGKIDIGINPESPEGIWLRRRLEGRHIPFIAFRAAVPGAATAPHIHLGTGSSRIGFAQR
jgi:Fe2+ transport system protein FeoA